MYLHEDKEMFKDVIEQIVAESGRAAVVVEKDYYVTMILRLLSQRLSNVVFKGGTSLSKGFKVISRFSEDIDITFDEHIGEARRKKLKNDVLKGISEELGMPIANWEYTQSDRDYNAYFFTYESVWGREDDRVPSSVKLETALGSYAFPTEVVIIGNYIGDYFIKRERPELAKQYMLDGFEMKLQAIERTFIDKVFALCDYYVQGKSKRYSRHLYDIYKLSEKIDMETVLRTLYSEVREHRKKMGNCPSAEDGVNISKVIIDFCNEDFYKNDYREITNYFSDDYVTYEGTIARMREIARSLENLGVNGS